MMRATVNYENRFNINIEKAFNLTSQWLSSQYKAKIKKSRPHSFIEAKQGTMMTNTGHDPNWKKRIRINFYQLEQNKTLIKIEAMPLARNILRIEKLKRSWYNGLFSHLFSILQNAQENPGDKSSLKTYDQKNIDTKYCTNCGSKVDMDAVICPKCGVDIK
ncbi:MAG: zinc ribbon domain-containing protein [Candidatus Lokiarchaeota archaeon]|jgi:ribosomal protein L40E